MYIKKRTLLHLKLESGKCYSNLGKILVGIQMTDCSLVVFACPNFVGCAKGPKLAFVVAATCNAVVDLYVTFFFLLMGNYLYITFF